MTKGIGFVIALALIAGIPIRANSGAAIVTAHELSFSMKLVAQGQENDGDDKFDKETVDAKEVFEECRGAPPTKTQKIYLFMNCSTPSTNAIIIIDTDPLTNLEELGELTFDFARQIERESNGDTKEVLIPFTLELECNGGDTNIDLTGVMDLKLSNIGPQECPDTAKLTFTGGGNTPSVFGNFLVNKDSSITVKKRSASITTFPPL